MTTVLKVITATLALLVITCSAASSNGTKACDGLASYQLTLKTLWSKSVFSNQYPAYRPSAQWSRLIGRSHSSRYSLWSEGKMASVSLKDFAEQGVSTGLDGEPQGSSSVFDTFIGPHIPTGVGSTTVKFLVHSNYPKLSFVVRMIPSPDWFIGVDSVDLCAGDGQWKSDLTLDLHPIDAGTDRGFTFTSPNWPETQPIYVITSKHPNHPAGSFFYPSLDSLPPIAKLQLTKVNIPWTEDTTKDTVSPSSDALIVRGSSVEYYRESKSSSLTKSAPAIPAASKDSAASPVEVKKEVQASVGRKVVRRNRVNTHAQNGRSPVASSKSHTAAGDDQPIACEMSDWSDWTACSKTCGFGTRVRTRTIVRQPSEGGLPCSMLREEQLCGSMRNCGWQHFDRSNRGQGLKATRD